MINFENKIMNHTHYAVYNNTVYEYYQTIRGARYTVKGEAIFPDKDRLSDEDIKYIKHAKSSLSFLKDNLSPLDLMTSFFVEAIEKIDKGRFQELTPYGLASKISEYIYSKGFCLSSEPDKGNNGWVHINEAGTNLPEYDINDVRTYKRGVLNEDGEFYEIGEEVSIVFLFESYRELKFTHYKFVDNSKPKH